MNFTTFLLLLFIVNSFRNTFPSLFVRDAASFSEKTKLDTVF